MMEVDVSVQRTNINVECPGCGETAKAVLSHHLTVGTSGFVRTVFDNLMIDHTCVQSGATALGAPDLAPVGTVMAIVRGRHAAQTIIKIADGTWRYTNVLSSAAPDLEDIYKNSEFVFIPGWPLPKFDKEF